MLDQKVEKVNLRTQVEAIQQTSFGAAYLDAAVQFYASDKRFPKDIDPVIRTIMARLIQADRFAFKHRVIEERGKQVLSLLISYKFGPSKEE